MQNNIDLNFLNKELIKIQNFFYAKEYDTVILKAKVLIKKFPNIIPFYNAIGLAYKEKFEFALAKKYFLEALNRNPTDSNVLNNLGLVSKAEEDNKIAENYFQRAIKTSSKNLAALVNLGNLKREMRENDAAINLYEQALNIKADLPEVYMALADIYKSIGKYDLSKKYCEILNSKFPQLTEQDLVLNKIIDYAKDDSHQILMLKKIQSNNIDLNSKITLNFALAKSFEDQKKFDKSIFYINEANNLRRRKYQSYNINQEKILFSKILDHYKKYKEILLQKEFTTERKIIFVVGLPRSGTTLLHQILSNNKNIYGAGELVFFNKPFTKLFSESDIDNGTIEHIESIKDGFLKKINSLSNNQNVIIDKTPGNFVWLGFLKYLFPNSKIVHCRRDINDTAFSIYKNLFTENAYKWSYNKDELAEYISLYLKIMKFWSEEFKEEIFHNDYHELVNNPLEQTKKIFDFCDLKWNNEVISVEKSEVPIDTLSSTQARKSIYKDSINFYKNYVNLTDLFSKIDSMK